MKIKATLFYLILSFSLFAQSESGLYISGQTVDEFGDVEVEDDAVKSPFVYDSSYESGVYDHQDNSKKAPTSFIPEGIKDTESENIINDEEKNYLNQFDQKVMGSVNQSNNYVVPDDAKMIERYHNKGKKTFSFTYFRDTYDWSDASGQFQKVFEDETHGLRTGQLLIGFNHYFMKSNSFNLAFASNFGIGHSKGRGFFISGEKSQTTITLWQAPIQLGLSLDFPVSRYVKIFLEGGAAGMALLQHRDDRDSDQEGAQDDKTISQFGYGPYLKAKLGLSLSQIFPSFGRSLNAAYDIADSHLTFELNSMSLDGFADNVAVEGVSFGLGMSFEYL